MTPELRATFRKPFDEQVTAFRLRLATLQPTARWDDIWQSQHDRAFMVAGATKAELLADLAAAIDKAVSEGTTLEEFRRDFRSIVERNGWHGWTGEDSARGRAWRTRVIYQTNMRTSYAAGRWAQLMAAGYPLLVYRHGGSLDPRIQHLGWDGLILPATHPFWSTHAPPNGWGCSCYVSGARSEAGAVRLGGKPGKRLPDDWRVPDPKTGAPVGIDRGWAYAPGATVARTVNAIAPKIAVLPAATGAELVSSWPDRFFGAWAEVLGEFMDEVYSDPTFRRGRSTIVGAMLPEWVEALAARGVAPKSAEIAFREDDLRHMFRSVKDTPLDRDWFRQLPLHLRKPDEVYLDTTRDPPAMLLVLGRAPANKLVIQLDFRVKGTPVTTNMLNTGKVLRDAAGVGGKDVVRIWPVEGA